MSLLESFIKTATGKPPVAVFENYLI